MLLRVVAAAHQWATFHVTEALPHANALEAGEPVGMDELLHRQMRLRGLEVLAEREDVHAHTSQIVHALLHLRVTLPKPEHDAALGAQTGALGPHQHFQAAVVLGLHAYLFGQPTHRLQVVRKDVRRSLGHDGQVLPFPLEIGYQRFHGRCRGPATDRTDGPGPDVAATVLQIITVHAGDDAVLQSHEFHATRHPRRLEGVHGIGSAGGHGTEAATPRAYVPEDHERGRTRAPPLAHVGAVAAMADGVQLVLTDDLAHLAVALTRRQFHAQPVGTPYALRTLHRNDLAH